VPLLSLAARLAGLGPSAEVNAVGLIYQCLVKELNFVERLSEPHQAHQHCSEDGSGAHYHQSVSIAGARNKKKEEKVDPDILPHCIDVLNKKMKRLLLLVLQLQFFLYNSFCNFSHMLDTFKKQKKIK
jgi:hypothetical protein